MRILFFVLYFSKEKNELIDCISFNFYFPLFETQTYAAEASGKLKAKRVSLDAKIFLIQLNPAINSEERNTLWPVLQAL